MDYKYLNLVFYLCRMIQPDPEIKKRLRPMYSENADSLTFASQVVAINFQTVAAANNYWKLT